jgi:ribosomal protein S8
VEQYAAKRAALKEIANDEDKPMEERFKARLKLAKLPRNSSATRLHNRCQLTGRRTPITASSRSAGSRCATWLERARSPAWSSRAGKEVRCPMNDPIGDMLTRIRNAQMRGKSTVDRPRPPSCAPGARCAGRRRLHPRLRKGDRRNGHPAFEISLKYYEGTPVIRELKRVSKPGRRVYIGVGTSRRSVRAWAFRSSPRPRA